MNKKVIIPTILFIVVFIFSFFVFSQEKDENQTQTNRENQPAREITLFYGDGCPHCEIVEEFINENKIQNKISFSQKEVYYNQNNLKELEAKAKICGLPTDSIGVPFLWDGETCLSGDKDIINFFKQKTDAQ